MICWLHHLHCRGTFGLTAAAQTAAIAAFPGKTCFVLNEAGDGVRWGGKDN